MVKRFFIHVVTRIVLVFVLLFSTLGSATSARVAAAFTCDPAPGILIDAMETASSWIPAKGNAAISISPAKNVSGYKGQAVQIDYVLGSGKVDDYVQIRRDFNPSLNLSAADHLRFSFTGSAANSIQVGITTTTGNYFSTDWPTVTKVGWWAQGVWDLNGFHNGSQALTDRSQVRAIFISVKKIEDQDAGGAGSFAVDELVSLNLASRSVPVDFDWLPQVYSAKTTLAAAWIRSQQKPSGLLKSWKEETAPTAWLYDQAVGLLVLTRFDMISAHKLVGKLQALQNLDGSWYAGYNFETSKAIDPSMPVGAIAWTVYALADFAVRAGSLDAYHAAHSGASWLASIQRSDGSLPGKGGGDTGAPTEANLDAWWAFQAAGFRSHADKVKSFLLNQVWNNGMGRFRASSDNLEIRLDNLTWGAAFLKGAGRDAYARRVLSYANATLKTYDSKKQTCGFDGAGPFSVWDEGTLQYIAAGGEDSQYFYEQMLLLQSPDGSMSGSPDNLENGMVWLTTMHGIAPTAWLYFAGTGGPFYLMWYLYGPVILKQ